MRGFGPFDEVYTELVEVLVTGVGLQALRLRSGQASGFGYF